MKKWIVMLVLTGFAAAVIVLNLGRVLDASEEPVKSDIVVCLGGGAAERVDKAVQLYKNGYARRQIFLLIGESSGNQPYIRKHFPDLNILINERPENTREEILAVKTYMKIHGYRSAIIVTDPPHTRRARLLTSLVSVDGDGNMTFHFVGSDAAWWNTAHYYENEKARKEVLHEVGGILYAIFVGN
jgi:uncharacterized SAM-binding protein YcdF (DUF218 family)